MTRRCGNTIHSDYVTDHRCQLRLGHAGDCAFGGYLPTLLREFEALPVRRATYNTVVMERLPLDTWRARCGAALADGTPSEDTEWASYSAR